ncbi:MAG TPA: hypothetical protein VH413_09400 [Verrucomicrobiae bacterium]|jgi:hypothetical protein|nr:hypothetical protein [Verrucomicrobiae bacterium]
MKTLRAILGCVFANALLVVIFTIIYYGEGHLDKHSIERIDQVLMSWGWLLAFFLATFFSLRKTLSKWKVTAASVLCAMILIMIQWLTLGILFDPMF